MNDMVKHPKHYSSTRFGVECIEFARYMTFPAGNAFKYLWRHEDKGTPKQDLQKALVYLNWAREDWESLDIPAILPNCVPHLTRLATNHLPGMFPPVFDVYSALPLILEDFYGAAIKVVEAAEDRL